MDGIASSSSHSSFCEEVFSRCSFCSDARRGERGAADTAAPTTRMRWTGQIFWLLAYNACAASHLVPAFTPEIFRGLAQNGKSYPVTAAQLLPILTGFLAPIH